MSTNTLCMLFGNEATAILEFKIQFVYYLSDVQCVCMYVCVYVDFPVVFFYQKW